MNRAFTLGVLIILCAMLGETCTVDIRESKQGVEATVSTERANFPRVRALVCRPLTVSRTGEDGFDLRSHVKRLDGENCAWVTFRCGENGEESAEVEVCVGAAAVPTGCATANGKPLSFGINEIFR